MKAKESAGLAIIFEGKVLLAHTTGRGWWGSYGIPKGGIDEGESKLDAAIRETYEEIGVKVPMHMIDKTEHTYTLTGKGQKVNKIVYWYIVKLESLSDLKIKDLKIPKKDLQVEEVDWAGFIPYSEAMKRVMKSQINVINNLRGSGLIENNNSLGDKYNKSEPRMKYVKLFEEFINEANEEILAQGACKNAIFMAQKRIDSFFKKAQAKGYITTHSSKVKPYNSGYELQTDGKQLSWREVEALDIPKEIKNKMWNLFSTTSNVYLHPDTFFDSNLEENGQAIITGKTLDVKKGTPHDETWPRFIIKSKKDIKKVAKTYDALIAKQIDYIEKELGL